jgi:hypothetical protein
MEIFDILYSFVRLKELNLDVGTELVKERDERLAHSKASLTEPVGS